MRNGKGEENFPKRGSSRRGQALVEFALGSGIFVIFLVGLVQLTQLALLRQRVLALSRLGTMLQGYGLVADDAIHSILEQYWQEIPSPFQDSLHVETGRFLATPASRFYHLVKTKVTIEFKGFHIKEEVVVHPAPPGPTSFTRGERNWASP